MTQMPAFGPFSEMHFADERWFEPSAFAHLTQGQALAPAARTSFGQVDKWAVGLNQWLHPAIERADHVGRKARAYFGGEVQFSILVESHQQRTEPFPRALRFGVTANDEFLGARDLVFDPGAATLPRFIRRHAALADQSLQFVRANLF